MIMMCEGERERDRERMRKHKKHWTSSNEHFHGEILDAYLVVIMDDAFKN